MGKAHLPLPGSVQVQLSITVVGDFNAALPAHAAVDASLASCASALADSLDLRWNWLSSIAAANPLAFHNADGIWCTPGTPYTSLTGALAAIRFAREFDVPLLGTCGGFQYVILEHAQHVLGWQDAGHEEIWPASPRPVISKLSRGLLNVYEPVMITDQRFMNLSRVKDSITTVDYYCRFGINPQFAASLWDGDFVPVAVSKDHQVRAVTRRRNLFFFATLYQPELQVLRSDHPPLIESFVKACWSRKVAQRPTSASDPNPA